MVFSGILPYYRNKIVKYEDLVSTTKPGPPPQVLQHAGHTDCDSGQSISDMTMGTMLLVIDHVWQHYTGMFGLSNCELNWLQAGVATNKTHRRSAAGNSTPTEQTIDDMIGGVEPNGAFTDVCLVTSLRHLGVPLEYSSNGPFRALRDGNQWLSPFGMQLKYTPHTKLSQGNFIRWKNNHFVAVVISNSVVFYDGERTEDAGSCFRSVRIVETHGRLTKRHECTF